MKELHSIRTGININLQNCLVKSSTALNPLHNPFSVETILLHLVTTNPRLICAHTTFQVWKLLSHIHLSLSLNACKTQNVQRWVLHLEMLQLSDIWLSCVVSFDLFTKFLMSGDLSGGHGVKSLSYDHYMCRNIYVVWKLTLSREVTRIVYGILKKPRHQACKLKKAANIRYCYSISPHVNCWVYV